MLIFTAPGQGAQTPGFLSPWLEIPGLAEQFGAWSELAGRDLIRLGTTGSAEEITDTAVAQPLLVASAIAVAGLLGEPDAAAGHSVGELAAGAIAGVLTAADAIRLTRVRGESMAAACDAEATGMTAVLGGAEAAVLGARSPRPGSPPPTSTRPGRSWPAAPSSSWPSSPPTRPRAPGCGRCGWRARSTPSTWRRRSTRWWRRRPAPPCSDPVITLLSNRDGAVVTSGPAWVERIVHQVANPVRWDLCMATMSDINVTALIELLPGGTLTGMAKRALPGVELLAIKTPDQLDAARALIAAHATATNGYAAELGRVARRLADRGVAGRGDRPFGRGSRRAAGATPAGATMVCAGDVLAHVAARGGEKPVTARTERTTRWWWSGWSKTATRSARVSRLVRLQPTQRRES